MCKQFLITYFFSTDVSEEEQGNYTCYVNNINMMRMKIIVVSKTRLLTQGQLKLHNENSYKIHKI